MNKKISITISSLMGVAAMLSLLFSSCSKNNPSLGALPVPSFTSVTLTPTSDANAQNLELINTTPTPGIAYWNIPGVGNFQGDTVMVTFVFAGSYPVQLAIAAQGGIDSVTQSVNIDQNNPYAVSPTTLLGVLTGAGLGKTQRTWTPNRVIASCVVWDNYNDILSAMDGAGGSWWQFGAAEIAKGTGRDGYLDDQYTFTFEKVGQLIFNDNNTVYLDQGGSGWTGALPNGWNGYLGTYASTRDSTILASSQAPSNTEAVYRLVPALTPWGSGTFTYSFATAPAGAMGLGTITVNGVGAHFGLQDKTNGSDVNTPTATSVTYDVLRISTNLTDAGGTYDELIVGISAGAPWGFRFKSYQ
jgi:hypothetical protein